MRRPMVILLLVLAACSSPAADPGRFVPDTIAQGAFGAAQTSSKRIRLSVRDLSQYMPLDDQQKLDLRNNGFASGVLALFDSGTLAARPFTEIGLQFHGADGASFAVGVLRAAFAKNLGETAAADPGLGDEGFAVHSYARAVVAWRRGVVITVYQEVAGGDAPAKVDAYARAVDSAAR